MTLFWILISALIALTLLCLLISYVCFRMAFYAPRSKSPTQPMSPPDPDAPIDFPVGEIYEPFHESMQKWAKETRALPQVDFHITSFDGLNLHGKYFEYAPGAPIELMFHGYRGSAERDLSGGVQRCFKLGRSCLVVDQRCSGGSGGNVITFGLKEHRDCLAWVDFMVKQFGPDVKIILTGISMGAATVLMAAGKPLPSNVIGVLADCGYSSPKDIICEVIRQMKLPPVLAYPFVKLGAKIYGHFDLEEDSPVESLKHSTVPIIFFHGEADDFVPCYMSQTNFEACASSNKRLVTIPGAGHGLSYPLDPPTYLAAAREFFEPFL